MRSLLFVVLLLSCVTFPAFGQDKPTADNSNTQNWKAVDDAAAQKLKKYNKYKLIRTSQDSNLLKGYIELYKHNGGELYIIMMQQKYKLSKEKDTIYKLVISPQDEAETGKDHPEWNDFLYCPIGKTNGTIIVLNADGEKMQEWHYRNEKKEGFVYWYNTDNSISNTFVYKDDVLQQKK
jgi:hypothetical protein